MEVLAYHGNNNLEIKTKYHKMFGLDNWFINDFNHDVAIRGLREEIDEREDEIEREREIKQNHPVNPELKAFLLDPLFCQWELNHVKQNRLFIDEFYKRIFDGLK